MPPIPIPPPYVNGNFYDFSVLKFWMNSVRYFNLMDIDYKNTGTFGKVRGTGSYIRGRTAGTVDTEGSFTMYLNEWDAFVAALMALGATQGMVDYGYMDVSFGISCSYGKTANAMRTDDLIGCRIKGDDYSHKEGPDALVVKVDLDILQLNPNGAQPMGGSPFGVVSALSAAG